jgi:hypothetical protein
VILLSIPVAASLSVTHSVLAQPDTFASAGECVCGGKKVVLLLFDFVDVKHTKTPEYYSGIVKAMNASFYRQS